MRFKELFESIRMVDDKAMSIIKKAASSYDIDIATVKEIYINSTNDSFYNKLEDYLKIRKNK
jgi:hypothetical protein